jgi:hypothetical protein
VTHPDDAAHPLRQGVQPRVPQHPPDVLGRLVSPDKQIDDAIRRMAEPRVGEVIVQREQRRPPEAMKKPQDLLILNACPANVMSDLPELQVSSE